MNCNKCANSTTNPTITVLNGLCNVCRKFQEEFDREVVQKELNFLRSCKGEKVLVGISGGKDSTATLYETKEIDQGQDGNTFREVLSVV